MKLQRKIIGGIRPTALHCSLLSTIHWYWPYTEALLCMFSWVSPNNCFVIAHCGCCLWNTYGSPPQRAPLWPTTTIERPEMWLPRHGIMIPWPIAVPMYHAPVPRALTLDRSIGVFFSFCWRDAAEPTPGQSLSPRSHHFGLGPGSVYCEMHARDSFLRRRYSLSFPLSLSLSRLSSRSWSVSGMSARAPLCIGLYRRGSDIQCVARADQVGLRFRICATQCNHAVS